MFTQFGQITVTVRDYDEAIAFYVDKLGFSLVRDARPVPGIRWVSVAPQAKSETVVVFEKAQTKEDWARLGKQFPGMTLTLCSDDVESAVVKLEKAGVRIV